MNSAIDILWHINWGIGYIITFVIFFVVSFISEYYKTNKFIYLFLAYLILFSSTRVATAPDTRVYEHLYRHYKGLSPTTLEPGFIFISWLLNHITPNPYALLFCYSFLTITFVYLAIRKFTPYVKTSLFIYLTIPIQFSSSLVFIRENLAEAIMFYALSFIPEGKIKKFLFWGILSIMFHYSALIIFSVSIIVYIFFKDKFNIKLAFLSIIFTFFIHMFRIDIMLIKLTFEAIYPFLLPKYQQTYALPFLENKLKFKGFSTLGIIVLDLLSILTIYYPYKLIKKNIIPKKYIFILNLIVIGTIILNLFGMESASARLYYYFTYLITILISFILYNASKDKMKNLVLIYSLSVFLVLWFLKGVYSRAPGTKPSSRYENIILKNML
ncbi:MAG: EpsG family protein [Hydrogenobaculum sp.]